MKREIPIRLDQELPPIHPPTRIDPDRVISILKARCVARYRLHSVPGRPEELVANDPHAIRVGDQFGEGFRVISFGYLHGSIRIRKHDETDTRRWADTRDFAVTEADSQLIWAYLDPFFRFVSPDMLADRATLPPRPIRDNPQA